MWSTGYDKLAPAKKEQFDGSTLDFMHDAESNAMFTNMKVCDFAYQISSGLQHLEKMNVRQAYTRHACVFSTNCFDDVPTHC